MAQQILDGFQVPVTVQDSTGESVPKGMKADLHPFVSNASIQLQLLDNTAERTAELLNLASFTRGEDVGLSTLLLGMSPKKHVASCGGVINDMILLLMGAKKGAKKIDECSRWGVKERERTIVRKASEINVFVC